MKSNIKNVAVVGTGVIGTGWIIRCLAHDKKVIAFDKDLKLKKRLVAEIKRTWPYVKKLFNKNAPIPKDMRIEYESNWQLCKTKCYNFIKFIWVASNKNIFKM